MTSALKCVVTFLCLASVPFVLYLTNFSYPLTAAEDNHLNLLIYEVNNVYVGKLKHTIQICNNAFVEIRGGKLFVPIIRNETARHYVILCNVSSSTQPTIRNDISGNIYACWNDITIDRHQTLSVELNYYLVSFDVSYLVNSSLIADYNVNSGLYQKYTQPEELIESNASEIVSLAQNLTINVDDLYEKVLEIYNFVVEHLHYMVQSEERGALWALEEGVGDCSEYSYLFVALCRAAEIPARVQAGFAFHTHSETLKDGHMWAEYYLENYGWIPVDASWRLFDTVDDRHFSSIRSIPEDMPYANYFFDYTIGPEEENVKDEEVISLTPCSTDVFGDSFAENVVKTVPKIRQTEFAILLGKVFGTPLIFPSEVKQVEQTFRENEIQLQNAIDSWQEHPQIAESNVVNALKNVEKTLQNAWILMVKEFTILISTLIVILLIGLFFLKRYQTKQNKAS
jgi:hypothetical protein